MCHFIVKNSMYEVPTFCFPFVIVTSRDGKITDCFYQLHIKNGLNPSTNTRALKALSGRNVRAYMRETIRGEFASSDEV